MSNEKLVKRLTWGIISFQIFLTAILFIIQILRIYYGRKNEIPIFTRELAGKAILDILIVIILLILFVIVGGVLSYKYNLEDKKLPKKENLAKLKTIMHNIPEENKNTDDYKELIKLGNKRYYAYFVATLISLVCIVIAFLYMFNTKHFISTGNALEQCNKLFIYVTPLIIISFFAFIIAKIYEDYNAKASCDLAKKIIDSKNCNVAPKKNEKAINIIKYSILVAAVIMVIVGGVIGGANDVFLKAAKICSECIGLG
ncbi:MAG: hypothetical protein MR357_06575 [Anaeroplasma sp.]|nr:hypothetical protein [Anaeroplasma sp.]